MSQLVKNEESFMLVTVLQHAGSSPGKQGAHMIVLEEETYGTIGGGQVEYQATLYARELLKTQKCEMKIYSLSNEKASSLGMVCGGEMLVYFCHSHCIEKDQMELLDESILKHQSCWLQLKADNETAVLSFVKHHIKQIQFVKDGSNIIFLQPIIQNSIVYIFGGGHIARHLVPLLKSVDFQCAVIDTQEEFVLEKDFPNTRRIVMPFEDCVESLDLTPQDYAVIVTRGHAYDKTVLAQVLGHSMAYIGMIGSKKKIAYTYQCLQEEGFTQVDFQSVHAPIGIPLGGNSPGEIAVSITAELIKVRHEKGLS